MQGIVETLTGLNGVRHVGIYKNGKVLSTNFPEATQQAMLNSSEVVAQVFLALEAIKKTHNEIFIGINNGYLAGFRLFGGHVVLLLTDKKINIPLLSMGIKSASEMLKQQVEEFQHLQSGQFSTTSSVANASVDPTDEVLVPVINQYTYLLTEFLGPAASVVVDDAVKKWKATYTQIPNNLTYLVAELEGELETDKEKQAFMAKVDKVVMPDM